MKKVHWKDGKRPEKTPLFSGVTSYGGLVFIAGVGAHFEGDIKAHTKHVLDEIQKKLEEVGSSMEKVLKVNVYLNDLKDYAGDERDVPRPLRPGAPGPHDDRGGRRDSRQLARRDRLHRDAVDRRPCDSDCGCRRGPVWPAFLGISRRPADVASFAAACRVLAAAARRRPAGGRPRPPARPNVIFILADDLGYAELGSYGQQKIRTPSLDRLAAEGVRFTQHYSGNAVCAPSRSVLLTGQHPGHTPIRDNRELQPEGQVPLPAAAVTIAELFKKQGYATAAMGKWGLGPPGSEGDPLRQGFDHFFGYNCQRQAHNHYPTYLYDDDRRLPLDNPAFPVNQKLPDGADPADPRSYAGYAGKAYAPDLIGERARAFIRDNKDRPFFLYLPTTVPHLALQVPEDSLAEYRGLWPDPPYRGDNGYLPNRSPRAAYAAMVTRMDREVGRILDLVRELGLDERTIVVFTSDNGPTYDRIGGSDSEFFRSAGPLRGLKGSLYEGGIRVPAIVRWKGRIPAGLVSERVTGFEDWLPTLLELAGAKEAIPPTIDGLSFAPTLLGQAQEPRPVPLPRVPGLRGAAVHPGRRLEGRAPGAREAGAAAPRALRPEGRRRRVARRGGGAPRRGRADGGAPLPRAPAVGGVPDPGDRRGDAPLRRRAQRGHDPEPARGDGERVGGGPAHHVGARLASPRASARSPRAPASPSATT